ncbi:DHBP synthase RibB-like alpha/beta domain-containing protein [Pholiota molesta]|nr:DHBP synthase RibB-like alpha/beta domain-containing protein [Pholiota molesta]
MILSRLRQIYALTTQILKCDPSSITFLPSSDEPEIASQETIQALKIASHQLVDQAQTVVFPTETVYGLGATALDSNAAAKIFSTKGRPPDNPLIVHVSSFTMLHSLLPLDYVIPKSYQALMKHFWPGQDTVAIRMPSHPVARALIALANTPLAAPSANTSGKPSPTRAEHVYRDLNGKVSLILDGGPCGVGLESTVVDGLHPDGNIRVLRPGGITVEDIELLVHKRDYADEQLESAPTTPGMKYRHYSPSVPVILLCTLPSSTGFQKSTKFRDYVDTIKSEARPGIPLKIGVLAPTDSQLWEAISLVDDVEWHRYPLGSLADQASIARHLFDGLLSLEEQGVQMMLIEEVEEGREGLAIMNRVRKAASESVRITYQ